MSDLMRFFSYKHLPERLQDASRPFWELATHLDCHLPNNAEKTVALRKLLESKDCAVRAMLDGAAPERRDGSRRTPSSKSGKSISEIWASLPAEADVRNLKLRSVSGSTVKRSIAGVWYWNTGAQAGEPLSVEQEQMRIWELM